MTDLTDRVVLVTGAAGGVGRALVRAFAGSGRRGAAADVNGEVAETVTAELGRGRGIAVAVDVTDPGSCERVVAETVERFGALHALVNNAGIGAGVIRQDHFTRPIVLDE